MATTEQSGPPHRAARCTPAPSKLTAPTSRPTCSTPAILLSLVGDQLQLRGRLAEHRNRMTPFRVAQREVGQVATQHSGHPGAPCLGKDSGKHSGSVSYMVYSVPWSLAQRVRNEAAGHRVADLLNPAATLLPAANVIMQLALPGVGYGVLESPVDTGNVYKHPFKRARTTGTYLAVATIGTESDRALIRDAVDVAHRQVRSTSSSPVSYNAFDPKLQLWVASRLYRCDSLRPTRIPVRTAR